METKDIVRSIEETKDLIRRVRTPAGARRFGQPIGTVIVPDAPLPRAPRKGTRRAQSMAEDRKPTEPVKGRQRRTQRTEDRPVVLEAAVAPEPEVAEGSDQEVDVSRTGASVYTESQTYVQNDPLIASALDMDFMKKGTAQEAYNRLKAMGAKVEMGKAFVTNREFMVTLSEVTRVLEEEFPGFAARHGNFFSINTVSSTGGFNTFMRKGSTTESNEGLTGENIQEQSVTTTVFGGRSQQSIEAADNNATATVFTPTGVNWTEKSLRENMSRRGSKRQSHMSMTDAMDSLLKKGLTPSQVGSLHVITHELGHAISRAVGGRMSFEIDGIKDAQQEQRRWYREYYANSRLEFLEEMGVAKRTGKAYVADVMVDQRAATEFWAQYLPKTVLPTKKPKRPAYNASPEARARALKRIEEWNSAHRRYRAEMQELNAKMSADVKALQERGQQIPQMTVTEQDKANGYNAESGSLWSFVSGLISAGFLEPGLDKMRPLTEMTSEYGSTNWAEIEAETWAAYMLNGNVTKGVSKWGEQMHTMYQWWTDDEAEMRQSK